MYSARTSRRCQFGTYYSKLRRCGAFSVSVAPTSPCWIHISTDSSALTACYKRIVGATWHSQHILLLAANTIIVYFCDGALLKSLYKMAASSKDKRTPITTPPYQVTSVDATPDQPIYFLAGSLPLNSDSFRLESYRKPHTHSFNQRIWAFNTFWKLDEIVIKALACTCSGLFLCSDQRRRPCTTACPGCWAMGTRN